MNVFETDITPVPSQTNISKEQFDTDIRTAAKPVILRGLVKDWPSVKAAQNSLTAIGEYIKSMDTQRPTLTYIGTPDIDGRYFYSPDMRGFNFTKRDIPLSASIDKLLDQKDTPAPIGIYAGASSAGDILPDFAAENPMPLLSDKVPPLLWLGNSARVAPHFDTSENIACSVSGKRRFLVFPPEQISNLYVGPIDHNMAGQPASLVDPENVDLEKFPKFKTAMQSALLAELDPGDALYLPSLWWHYVKSSGPLNVLVNYWWQEIENNSPMDNIALALLTLRDLPKHERAAWRAFFDHYIFGDDVMAAVDHVPEPIRGVLGKKSAERDARIKGFLRMRLPETLK